MVKYNLEEIENHLEQWKESGLSKKDYCEQASVNYWAFKRWCCSYGYVKKRVTRPQNEFIQLKPTSGHLTGKIEVIYPNGVRIQLPSSRDKELLQILINL